MKNKFHQSVMVNEVVLHLNISAHSKTRLQAGRFIDATVGTGGHSQAIIDSGGEVLGLEVDPKMLRIAKKRLPKASLVLANFVNIDRIAKIKGFVPVDGILFDLGVSNIHLKDDDRGFSFSKKDQLLDMRLNPKVQKVKASDLLNILDSTQLTKLFSEVMKYPDAKKLAKRVVEVRPILTVGELKKLCYGVGKKKGLDSATLPLLALRIATNSELENLEEVLPKAYELLKPGGKLLVITFHSAEVEIVKKFNKSASRQSKLELPSKDEVSTNPRARSAKLWIIQKK